MLMGPGLPRGLRGGQGPSHRREGGGAISRVYLFKISYSTVSLTVPVWLFLLSLCHFKAPCHPLGLRQLFAYVILWLYGVPLEMRRGLGHLQPGNMNLGHPQPGNMNLGHLQPGNMNLGHPVN
jgi:hypothetical protein